MNIASYKNYLSSRGTTLGQVKRTQSDVVMNNTFTLDPTYKKVYILTKDGWKWEDAKYQFHSAPSITKDAVDYYLQFRPKVHYPVGSYVIVPDDTDFDINLSDTEKANPFSQPIENRSQWWIIVGRDEANAYVRYMILKCDWDFRWVYKGKLMRCWACSKSASSYTSGRWTDEYTSSLDNLTNSWLPDTYYVYGDKLEELGMCDTRTVFYNQRFFLSNNDLEPKIYQVTKVLDINPQGIIKLSIKQDELNEKRDNVQLRVCDYYTDEGNIVINIPNIPSIVDKTSSIKWMSVDENGELVNGIETTLNIGKTYYFEVKFSDNNIDPQWVIEPIGEYTNDEKDYYIGLMKMTKFDSSTLALKLAKASSLKGKKFTLSVSDTNGGYYSSIELEVAE
jgi:hypothetical protein